jgi:ribosomal protein S18 acetylase RimI-like enzyme
MSTNKAPSFSIREFCFPDDYPAVIDLWNHAGPGVHVRRSDSPEEIQKKLSRDPDLFLLAEVEGRLIGTVMGGFDGRRGMVYHLAVEDYYRRQGIGAALMEELEKRLKAKGCIRSYLMVAPGNEEVIDFYQRRGWEQMPITIMAKDLG